MREKLGDWFRFYRLLYSAVSLVTLIPLVYYSNSIQQAPFFRWEGYLVIVRYLMVVASIFLFVTGARHYSMSQLLGIHQIKTGRANRAVSGYGTLDTSGILGGCGHPPCLGGRSKPIHPPDQYRHQRVFCYWNISGRAEAPSRVW
jgi:hypothetical protein